MLNYSCRYYMVALLGLLWFAFVVFAVLHRSGGKGRGETQPEQPSEKGRNNPPQGAAVKYPVLTHMPNVFIVLRLIMI